jgi:hypothetical protein
VEAAAAGHLGAALVADLRWGFVGVFFLNERETKKRRNVGGIQ